MKITRSKTLLGLGSVVAALLLMGAGTIDYTSHVMNLDVATNATFRALTATTVPVLDASKKLISSSVTPTELSNVSGTTGPIQTQLAGKAATTAIDNTAYDATSWNGDITHAPTKDAVRDEIELLLTSGFLSASSIDTSAELRAILGDESGTGALIFAGGNIGAATATTAAAANSSTLVATTAFVAGEVATAVNDTAYNATSWDGDTTHAPSKNAVRDKIEALPTTIVTFTFGNGDPPVDGSVTTQSYFDRTSLVGYVNTAWPTTATPTWVGL